MIESRLLLNIHQLHYISYEIGLLFKVVMEDCHSIVCVKYVHILSYKVIQKNTHIIYFCATAKSMVLVCRLLGVAQGGLSIKMFSFASLTTNNGN